MCSITTISHSIRTSSHRNKSSEFSYSSRRNIPIITTKFNHFSINIFDNATTFTSNILKGLLCRLLKPNLTMLFIVARSFRFWTLRRRNSISTFSFFKFNNVTVITLELPKFFICIVNKTKC